MESIAKIPQCDRETTDGRTYPAKRKKPSRTAYIDDTTLKTAQVVRTALFFSEVNA
jgi:hypothetical protein